jgi:regulator of RNase E activity RraB
MRQRSDEAMPDSWDFYFTRVNDKPASIFGNFGLKDEVPRESLPWLLVVTIHMKSPREDGSFTAEEGDVFWKIEDAIVPAVTERLGAELVGRITTDGRREFYFYSAEQFGFEQAVGQAMVPFGYEFDTDTREDRGWSFYFDVVYPTAWDLHTMSNRQVLKALTDRGDDLSEPRGIHHWIYFESADDREGFAKAAGKIGFLARELKSDKSGEARPWGIHAYRVDSVRPNDIDAVCYELFTLAEQHHGDYDGWETQVVKPGQKPTYDAPTGARSSAEQR